MMQRLIILPLLGVACIPSGRAEVQLRTAIDWVGLEEPATDVVWTDVRVVFDDIQLYGLDAEVWGATLPTTQGTRAPVTASLNAPLIADLAAPPTAVLQGLEGPVDGMGLVFGQDPTLSLHGTWQGGEAPVPFALDLSIPDLEAEAPCVTEVTNGTFWVVMTPERLLSDVDWSTEPSTEGGLTADDGTIRSQIVANLTQGLAFGCRVDATP